MTEHADHYADQGHYADPGSYGQGQEAFELERRGYSRRQVDEFAAQARSQVRDLSGRLQQAMQENERIRQDLSAAHQAVSARPHEQISERVRKILELADDEAKAQRQRANEEIAQQRGAAKQETDKLRADVKQETDKIRADAQNQAERMLRAAQDQAENSISSARAEAEKTRNAARAEAERSIADAHRQAETTMAGAKSQATQLLDEATARANAIHDGAERRLNLLMARHTEGVRRLTEIRDVVTGLVAGEAARGPLDEEVAKVAAATLAQERPGLHDGIPGSVGTGNPRQAPADPVRSTGRDTSPRFASPTHPGPTLSGPTLSGPTLSGPTQSGPTQSGPVRPGSAGAAPGNSGLADALSADTPPAGFAQRGMFQPAGPPDGPAEARTTQIRPGGGSGRAGSGPSGARTADGRAASAGAGRQPAAGATPPVDGPDTAKLSSARHATGAGRPGGFPVQGADGTPGSQEDADSGRQEVTPD
jgi:cell division septum initiation protein DivIVA